MYIELLTSCSNVQESAPILGNLPFLLNLISSQEYTRYWPRSCLVLHDKSHLFHNQLNRYGCFQTTNMTDMGFYQACCFSHMCYLLIFCLSLFETTNCCVHSPFLGGVAIHSICKLDKFLLEFDTGKYHDSILFREVSLFQGCSYRGVPL